MQPKVNEGTRASVAYLLRKIMDEELASRGATQVVRALYRAQVAMGFRDDTLCPHCMRDSFHQAQLVAPSATCAECTIPAN